MPDSEIKNSSGDNSGESDVHLISLFHYWQENMYYQLSQQEKTHCLLCETK